MSVFIEANSRSGLVRSCEARIISPLRWISERDWNRVVDLQARKVLATEGRVWVWGLTMRFAEPSLAP